MDNVELPLAGVLLRALGLEHLKVKRLELVFEAGGGGVVTVEHVLLPEADRRLEKDAVAAACERYRLVPIILPEAASARAVVVHFTAASLDHEEIYQAARTGCRSALQAVRERGFELDRNVLGKREAELDGGAHDGEEVPHVGNDVVDELGGQSLIRQSVTDVAL